MAENEGITSFNTSYTLHQSADFTSNIVQYSGCLVSNAYEMMRMTFRKLHTIYHHSLALGRS